MHSSDALAGEERIIDLPAWFRLSTPSQSVTTTYSTSSDRLVIDRSTTSPAHALQPPASPVAVAQIFTFFTFYNACLRLLGKLNLSKIRALRPRYLRLI